MKTTKVLAGKIELELPIVPIPDAPISIILFDSFGDTKMIHEVAKEAVAHFTKPDILVCPEAKGIPLAQEMSRLWDIDYFVLRKSKKLYMHVPKNIDASSITTAGKQQLWYDLDKIHQLEGKNVMLFDDVISTGGTLAAMLAFANECHLNVSSIGTIFIEGESPLVQDTKKKYKVETLGYLPLLDKED